MRFSFMNKDIEIFKFNSVKDFGGTVFLTEGRLLNGVLPLGFTDLNDWIKSRYILNYRYQVEELLGRLGIVDLDAIISITNCVSLNDTYWVKPEGSNIQWSNVSPYRNSLNKVVSMYSFDGTIEGKNITSSPDFSTDGTFPKCWRRNNGKIYMYKAGTTGAYNAGYEPYSEVFACQLAKYLGMNAVEYTLGHYRGMDVSICECMCTEEVGLVQLRKYISNRRMSYEDLKLGYSDLFKSLSDMFLLDILTCNVDRHYGNVGLFVENDTQNILGVSKIYDNNLSCIPYYCDDTNLIEYINSLRCSDRSTFIELFRLIENPVIRGKLRKAISFRFKPIGNKRADKRVSILNKMLKYQIERCLNV